MTQKSICSFLNIVNIYNLEYLNKIYVVKSYVEKKSNFKIIKQISRPRLLTFTFNNTISLEKICESEFEFHENKYKSILKSNLQKSIRRNLPNTALTTAIKLLQIKGGSLLLLRRLCIIIVEDKLKNIKEILESYKLLIWIMSSEYGPKGWKNWILGLIKTICKFEYLYLDHNKSINIWYNNDYSNYFMIRSYFGGMKGDMRLLQNVAKYINESLSEISDEIIIEPIKNIKIIDKINILKSAVDFHCMPNMLNNIKSKHDEYYLEEIKKAIWIYSSSKRYKVKEVEVNDIWNTIKISVINYQKYIIDTIET